VAETRRRLSRGMGTTTYLAKVRILHNDREPTTGQNPPTDHDMAERFVKAVKRV